MEETKLDKAVDKLFRFVERFSNKFMNTAKSLSHYFGLTLVCVYIPYIIVFAIDVYYNGWKFKLSNGNINIGLILRTITVLFTYPVQLYFFNRIFFKDIDLKLLKISSKFYVEKIVTECFKPIIADWREEYSTARNQNRKWHAFSINLRYVYAFISAMIQQSSLRRLFGFIRLTK